MADVYVVFLHISQSKHRFSLSSAAAFRRAIARERPRREREKIMLAEANVQELHSCMFLILQGERREGEEGGRAVKDSH